MPPRWPAGAAGATAVANLWMARRDGDNCPRRTSASPRGCRRGN